jgi:transcriptional regulator with XRE-family HTH domain
MTMINKESTEPTETSEPEEPILPSIGQVDGKQIHFLRQARGLSYDEFIKATGLSHDEILAIENGVLQPSNHVIRTIANALGKPVEALLVGAEEVEELSETEQPASMHRVIDIEDDDDPAEVDVVAPARGWKSASNEQRQRLYAAQKAADILREFSGDGVFSTGGSKSINPVDVITLAQWIVYGTHDQ